MDTKLVKDIEFPGPEPLNERQRKFCLHFFQSGKGKQSAIMAGYGEKNASVTATGLLKLPQVQVKLEELREHVKALVLDNEEGKFALVPERKARLTDIIRTELPDRVSAYEHIGAIKEYNLMDKVYEQPVDRPAVVQTFVFVLPDGTRVSPGQLRPKELKEGE